MSRCAVARVRIVVELVSSSGGIGDGVVPCTRRGPKHWLVWYSLRPVHRNL